MSKNDYVYIARLLSDSDMIAAKKLVSKSKEKARRNLTKEDVLGGPIKDVACDIDVRNMVDYNGAAFFYSDDLGGLMLAIDVLNQQNCDTLTYFNNRAGIDNEKNTPDNKTKKVLYAAIPSDRFNKFADDGKYIATGEGEYIDKNESVYSLKEAVIGVTMLSVWNRTGVNFEMKSLNSFLGKSGQSSEYFIAKNLRENAGNDSFVQNGWGKGNGGNDGNEM